MFKKILIANRGEIAVRIIRTCRDLGIAAVALYTEPDVASLHVRLADECVPLPPGADYRDSAAVLQAALAAGVDAVHPGYGFLAERPGFIDRCQEAGLVFIGPPASVVASLQCKTDALARARAAGFDTPDFSDRNFGDGDLPELRAEAERLGYPLMVQSCVGGRGRGSRVANSPAELDEAVRGAQIESQRFYGDRQVFLERTLPGAHVVAVQLLADHHGHIVHLGERAGSLQLGNQKMIVESPAPFLSPEQRERLWATALELARVFEVSNAGAIEFLVDQDGRFLFTELKARIQMDHPLTEMVSMVDLVAEQIRVAAGEPLSFGQADVRLTGWAMQCRISAEDPWHDFLPSPGHLTRVRLPGGPGVRVDTYVYSGSDVSERYDPTLAKVVVWAENRDECVGRLRRALQDFTIIGVPTNLPYLQRLVDHPDFISGAYRSDLLDQPLTDGEEDPTYLRDLAVAAAVAYARRQLTFRPTVPERVLGGWHRSIRKLG